VVYTGSAGVGPYAFTFEILVNTDIAVYKNSTQLALTTDYIVAINANGTGSITLTSAPVGSDRITIVGNRAVQRTSDFVTGGDLFANTLNDELDSQTIFVQQLADTTDRSIKAPVTDPTTINMTLPEVASRANQFLAFDGVGNPTTSANLPAYVYQGVKTTDPTLRNDATALQAGDLYYNSVTLRLRVYTGTSWADSASPMNITTQTFSGNGSQVNFTLSETPAFPAAVDVYLAGVAQRLTAQYSVSGNVLTFVTAPPNAANNVYVKIISSATGEVPPDGSVTEVKLADDARRAIRAQQYGSGTTAGTGTAYTLTVTPAATSYAANQTFWVTFHAASGASPTLQISGLASPPNLVRYDSTGALVNIAASEIPENFRGRVTLVSTTQALVEEMPPAAATAARAPIQPISASVAANALTVSASALTLDFRSTTIGSGTVTTVSGTPANLVVPSGATLGTVSAVQSDIVVLALNNAGTLELAVVNIAGGTDLSETGLVSTTAISAGATSASTVYSTTARTNVAYRVIGVVRSTQTTAGTWATAPSLIQGQGGQALAAMQSLGMGQTWQNVTGSRAFGTTYYNTTGRPIQINMQSTSGTANLSLTVNGTALGVQSAFISGHWIIPVGASYSVSATVGTAAVWNELR
jgi:hypothetical protein